MASLIPLSYRKLPSPTPKAVLHHEMQNPASHLCHINGFVKDIALHVLSPMLEYPLRGCAQPGVFRLNHPLSEEGKGRRVKLISPTNSTKLVTSPGTSYPTELLIDQQGRYVVVNHPKYSLTIVPKNPSEPSIITPATTHPAILLNAVIDHEENIYVLDQSKVAVAMYSSEGQFIKHIIELKTSSYNERHYLRSLAIDDKGHLYIGMRKIVSESLDETCIEIYSLLGEKIESVSIPSHFDIRCLCFDPITNRLYVMNTKSVKYYCLEEKKIKDFLPFSKTCSYGKIRVDIEGNIYISMIKGKISVYNKDFYLLSKLYVSNLSVLFALDENGKLCVLTGLETIETYDEESAGEEHIINC